MASAMDPILTTNVLNVVYEVSTLAVVVLGLAVVFGLLGVMNLAHGEFVMIGAYCAFFVQAQDLPFLAAVPVALLVCGFLGLVVERILVRPLYARPFDTLLATWGLSMLLREAVEAVYGGHVNDFSALLQIESELDWETEAAGLRENLQFDSTILRHHVLTCPSSSAWIILGTVKMATLVGWQLCPKQVATLREIGSAGPCRSGRASTAPC